jgi:4-hydroxybenzoyl-CoA thioesterase
MEHVCEIEIQWGDCDPAGIVFFPNYFAWFDRSTWHLFIRAGVPIEGLLRDKRCAAMPLTHAEADFSNPCRPGDILRLTSRIESIEARRINLVHEGRRGDLLILRGRETRAWTVAAPDKPSGIRGADIPDDIVEKLRAAMSVVSA